MRISQRDISVSLAPSKFVRFHSFSVENTLLRQHPVGSGSRPKEEEQKWRGDHAFNADAASFSLMNFIEPEVEAANPHLSKKEAHALALEKFNERLKQDLAFEHQENSHIDTTVHWQVVDGKNGKKELATKYGEELITLSQLWDHTRTYAEHIGNPLAYNREEERAQLLMQDAFIEGNANGFVSVISHPDAIRYVQVWERTQDGGIASQQIDLYATTGRDFTHAEGKALVQSITKYHQGHGTSAQCEDVQYAHALFTSGKTSVSDVRTIAVAHVFTDSTYKMTPVDMMTHIAIKTARDIQETTITLGRDFHTYVQKKIESFKDSLLQTPSRNKDSLSPVTAPVMRVEGVHTSPITNRFDVIHGIDDYTNGDVFVQDVLSEWVFDHTVLSLGVRHEVFSHSTLMLLMLEPEIRTHREVSTLTKSENVYELKDANDHDVHIIVESVLVFLQKIFGSLPQDVDDKKNHENDDTDGNMLDTDSSVGQIESGILVIMHALSFLARESGYTVDQNPFQENTKPTENIVDTMNHWSQEDTVRVASGRAMFGIVLWMILQGFDRGKDQSMHADIAIVDGAHEETKSKGIENFFYHAMDTFSIIWHLSMIKEAQMSQYIAPVVKGKKQKVAVSTEFPLSAIVYLYVRDRISIDTQNTLLL